MIRFRALGAIDLRRSDGEVATAVLRQSKRLALLTYLACAPEGQLRRRDLVVAMFWPELDDHRARDALTAALGLLRRSLGREVLISRGREEIGCDRRHFSADVSDFLHALHERRAGDALALFEGELLAGVHVSDAFGFEEWLDTERARFRGLAAGAAASLRDDAARAGRLPEALAFAYRAATLAPHDERMVRALVALQEASGDRVGALQSYESFAARLLAEFDAEPSDETRALAFRLRQRETAETSPHEGGARESPGDVPTSPPPPVEAVTAPARRARLSRVARIAAGAALAAGVVAWPDASHYDAAPRSPFRIAVFPFDVRGAPQHRYLGEGTMDVVSALVDGVGELRSVDPRRVAGRVQRVGAAALTVEQARQIMDDVDAGRGVMGTVMVLGGQAHVSASLYDGRRGADPLARVETSGSLDSLGPTLARLTRRLLAAQPVGTGPRLASLSHVDARDPVAERAYLEGEAMMRRGDYDSAAAAFRRAVERDSSFALAWYGLSRAASYGPADPVAPADAALRHRDRLTPRDRMLAEAFRALALGDGDRLDSVATEVVSRHPEHVEGWWLLGLSRWWHAWQRGRPIDDARAPVERALALDPGHREALHVLFIVERQQGRLHEAHALAARTFARTGPMARNLESGDAVTAFGVGGRESQERTLQRLRFAPSQSLFQSAAFVAGYTDHLDGARRIARILATSASLPASAHSQGEVLTALVELAAGRPRVAARHFGAAGDRAPVPGIVYEALFSVLPPLTPGVPALEALRRRVADWPATPHSSRDALIWLLLPPGSEPAVRVYLLGLLDARLRAHDSARR